MSPYLWYAVIAVVGYVLIEYISYLRNPLRKFPGPLISAYTKIPYAYHFFAGDHPKWLESLHAKYGPIVRTGPYELSFTTPSSYRDIYGFRKGHEVFTKTAAYDAAAFTDQTRSIVNEREPSEHAKMRKMLAPAFSDRSLRQQWPLITETVDGFINELKRRASDGQTIDLSMFFGLVTFDISTSLALGESNHSVEAGKPHPWAIFFKNGARAMGEAVAIMEFSIMKRMILAMKPPQMMRMIKELRMHEAMCIEMVKKRRDNPSDRPDILGLILEAHEKEGNSFTTEFMAAQLSDVVIAGTETTATALSTATHFVLRDRAILQKLRDELRGRFKSYSEITPATTADLEYLNAVLNEGMRMMAPVPWPPTREVPAGGDTVDGHFLPAGTWVSTNYFCAARSADNFKDPQEFRPERWISKNGDKLDGSQPFGLGTRSCIGKPLALTEMRLIMAKLHYTFDIEAEGKHLDWLKSTVFRLLWEKPALNVQLRERAVV